MLTTSQAPLTHSQDGQTAVGRMFSFLCGTLLRKYSSTKKYMPWRQKNTQAIQNFIRQKRISTKRPLPQNASERNTYLFSKPISGKHTLLSESFDPLHP